MKFSQAFKMAFVALKGNKMRSFLTMLGIIIGVVAVTLLISVVQGATEVRLPDRSRASAPICSTYSSPA